MLDRGLDNLLDRRTTGYAIVTACLNGLVMDLGAVEGVCAAALATLQLSSFEVTAALQWWAWATTEFQRTGSYPEQPKWVGSCSARAVRHFTAAHELQRQWEASHRDALVPSLAQYLQQRSATGHDDAPGPPLSGDLHTEATDAHAVPIEAQDATAGATDDADSPADEAGETEE